jgi:predicted Zn finger-like uncharacterized protein
MNPQTHSNMVITVTCPSCSSSFPVDPAKVPEGGVNARCSSCGDIFRVEKPAATPPVAASEDAQPAQSGVAPPPPEPPAVPAGDGHVDEAPHIPAIMDEEPPAAPAEPPPLPEPTPSATAAPSPAPAPTGPPPLPEPAAAAPEPVQVAPPPLPEPVTQTPEPAMAPPRMPPEPTPAVPEEAHSAAEPAGAEALGGPTPLSDAPATAPAPDPAPVQGFTFGKRDPTDKAKRLARVLVSDMIMYNAERHQSALAAGTLVQDFEDEIEKSWKEFVEQVGAELANGPGRGFWTEALNDILAKGQRVF